MSEDFSFILARISVFSVFLPLLIAVVRFRKLDWVQRHVFFLITLSVITETAAFVTGLYLNITNLFLVHLYTIAELVLIGIIYSKVIAPTVRKGIINGIIASFVIYAVLNSLFIEKYNTFNTYARALESLIVIVFSLMFFYKTMKEVKINKLESVPAFWLSIGLLLYFSSSFFIFIFSNYISPSVKLSFTFWGIHSVLNIVLTIFYTITLSVAAPRNT